MASDRSRKALLFVYLALIGAGIAFIIEPPNSVQSAAGGGPAVVLAWSVFYIVGGSVASFAVLFRMTRRALLASWAFEVAGLFLLVAANAVYTYSLFSLGFSTPTATAFGAAGVVAAFAISLALRTWDALNTFLLVYSSASSLHDGS